MPFVYLFYSVFITWLLLLLTLEIHDILWKFHITTVQEIQEDGQTVPLGIEPSNQPENHPTDLPKFLYSCETFNIKALWPF